MPIQPISTYQNNDNSLLQILQGGSGVITGIFDRAIQIGRDVSNKRTQQEQNLLGIRGQERALAQRGAQDLQQTIQDAQKFARGAYESDRTFTANRSDVAYNQDRQDTNDAFTQRRALSNDGLAQSNSNRNFGLDQRKVALEGQKMSAEAASLRQRQEDTRMIFGGGTEPALPEGPGTFADTGVLPERQGDGSMLKPRQTTQTTQTTGAYTEAEIRSLADPKTPAPVRTAILKKYGGGTKPPTQLQLEAARRAEENQRQKDVLFKQGQEDRVTNAAKPKTAAIKDFLAANMSAFPNSQPRLSASVDAGTKVNTLPAADRDLYNASLNTEKIETNAVNTMTEDAYVNFVGGQVTYTDGVADKYTEGKAKGSLIFKSLEFTPREKDLRREFYTARNLLFAGGS